MNIYSRIYKKKKNKQNSITFSISGDIAQRVQLRGTPCILRLK